MSARAGSREAGAPVTVRAAEVAAGSVRPRTDEAAGLGAAAASSLVPGGGLLARARRGVTWNLVGTLANQGSTLVAAIVLANVLGRATFGRFAIVQSTLLTLVTVATLAMGYTATKYVAEWRTSDPARAGRVLVLCGALTLVAGLVAGVGLLAGGGVLADRVLHAPELAGAVRLAGVAVFLYVANSYLTGALAGLEAYPASGRIGVVAGTVYVVACTAGGVLGGVSGVVLGLVLTSVLQCALGALALRRELRRWAVPASARGLGREGAVFTRFALPAALSGLSTMPAIWAANAVLVRQAGFDQMALYSAASNFRMLVLFLPSVFSGVAVSLLNHARGDGAGADYRRLFQANVGVSALVGLAIALGLASGGPLLLRAFGHDFGAALGPMRLLLGAGLAESVTTAAFVGLQSEARIWYSLLYINLPRDLMFLAMASLLARSGGAAGVALAYLLASLFSLVMVAAAVTRLGFGSPLEWLRESLRTLPAVWRALLRPAAPGTAA